MIMTQMVQLLVIPHTKLVIKYSYQESELHVQYLTMQLCNNHYKYLH